MFMGVSLNISFMIVIMLILSLPNDQGMYMNKPVKVFFF